MASDLILVHGATGDLGGRVVTDLLALGTPAAQIVAGVRDKTGEPAKALAAKGVQLRIADYDKKDTLVEAYAGIYMVVNIPTGGDSFSRVTAFENSIAAAQVAGIKRFVLLSSGNGRSDSLNKLAAPYIYAESRLRTSGVNWVILRQGLWIENNLQYYQGALQSGVLRFPASPNNLNPFISKSDSAKGLAALILRKDINKRVLSFDSNVAVSYLDIVKVLSEIGGKTVQFQRISVSELADILKQGLPDAMKGIAPFFAGVLGSFEDAAEAGETPVSNDFHELTGQSPEAFKDVVKRLLNKTA